MSAKDETLGTPGLLRRFANDEDGQDLIEYAFLVVFIAILTLAVLTSASASINLAFQKIIDAVSGA